MIVGFSLIIAASIIALPLFRLAHIGRKLVATLQDLQSAITSNTAAVNALTAAAGTVTPPHDFQPEVDAIAANTAAVNAVTTQLGGTAP